MGVLKTFATAKSPAVKTNSPFPVAKRRVSIDLAKLRTSHRETVLEPGDLVMHVTLPPPAPGSRPLYLKLRDRASYEFALASAAVVVTAPGGKITRARVALGGIGTKPWRSTEAENELRNQSATQTVFQKAAEAALRDAKPQSQNDFKVKLARRCLVHALKLATQNA
jgi:xanthine dehydrogenase YagS FAD-binding subunit